MTMKKTLLLDDYATMRNLLNEIGEINLQMKLDYGTRIKSGESDQGLLTYAIIDMDDDDWKRCSNIMLTEKNRAIWVGMEDALEVIEMVS